jgi:hypothetical protein
MSGGSSRHYVTGRIAVFMLLSMLAGCSALFGPRPAPTTEQAAPASEPVPEEAPAPASEPAASQPEAVAPREAPETRRVPPKPVYRPTPKPHPAPPPPQPPAAPVVPPPIVATRLLSSNDTHALLDAHVQRPDGKVIGRAIDMFADASGKPREMLVNLTGFMGIGDRKVRFPWNDFTFNASARKASITLAIPPGQPPAAESSKAKAAHSEGKRGADAQPLLRLIDATVERGNGTRVGRVIDVLIDNHGQPQAAVLDVGSLINERRGIAADWSALRFVQKDNAIELQTELSDAQINAAPLYVSDQPVRAVSPATPVAPASAAGVASGVASGSQPSR